jgi:hypothetical protein
MSFAKARRAAREAEEREVREIMEEEVPCGHRRGRLCVLTDPPRARAQNIAAVDEATVTELDALTGASLWLGAARPRVIARRTGKPLPSDVIMYAVPVCGPLAALKYAARERACGAGVLARCVCPEEPARARAATTSTK